MKLPIRYNKMTNEQQRQWIADRIQQLEREVEELKQLSRKLATGKVEVKILLDDRPDIVNLKLD